MIFNVIANIIFILVMPFLFLGVINRIKSFWAGRQGPPLFQPLFDFLRLLKKGIVISRTTTALFYWAPLAALLAVLAAAFLTPMAGGRSMIGFEGDMVVFLYLLGTAKFINIASAMDTGSSFEGMGAAREAAFTSLIEPAFFIIMGTVTAVSGAADFSGIKDLINTGETPAVLAASLCGAALFIMLLTEGSRIPVDDPNTHLELTMIHEVMVLDNSGPDLAVINYTAGLKMFLITSIMANFLTPAGLNPFMAGLLFTAIIFTAAILTGCVESFMARLRMSHVPQFVFFMISIAIVAFSIAFLMMNGGLK